MCSVLLKVIVSVQGCQYRTNIRLYPWRLTSGIEKAPTLHMGGSCGPVGPLKFITLQCVLGFFGLDSVVLTEGSILDPFAYSYWMWGGSGRGGCFWGPDRWSTPPFLSFNFFFLMLFPAAFNCFSFFAPRCSFTSISLFVFNSSYLFSIVLSYHSVYHFYFLLLVKTS